MRGPDTSAVAPTVAQKRLLDLTQKRLEKFVSLVPTVLVSDHPDTIHDTRVWSRRLQQVFRALFPKPRSGKSRKLARTLRNVRRALGTCRNLDVSIKLIEERIDTANSPAVRNAWDRVREYLRQKRTTEIVRAREEVSACDVIAFATRTNALLESAELSDDPQDRLKASVKAAFADWEESLSVARDIREAEQIHALRIAGKRLRYRTELLADLGETSLKPLVKSLKALQDELGDWHDRYVILQYVAECIARPNFLLNHPELGRTLLAEMERERHRGDAAVDGILKDAEKVCGAWAARAAGDSNE